MLQGLEVLRAPMPRPQPGVVAGRPAAHELHVVLGLAQLARDVPGRRRGAHQLVRQKTGTGGELTDLRVLGQGATPVRELGEPGVQGLHVEQPDLVRGRSLAHAGPPRGHELSERFRGVLTGRVLLS